MPCYLFTYHTFGSWMPDRPQGYVRRHQGILPPDAQMATLYRQNAKHEMVTVSDEQQRLAISTVAAAVGHICCRLHFVATDATHIHVLVSWTDDDSWRTKRNSLKKSLTIALKEAIANRPWFSEGASRKRVRDRQHFEYLVTKYLPSHSGWKWCEGRELFK